MVKPTRRLRPPVAVLLVALVALVVIGSAMPAAADPGDPDATFGAEGRVRTDFAGKFDTATDLTILPNGRIVVVGYGTDASDVIQFAVARYLANGDPDPSFSVDGKRLVDLAGEQDSASGVAVQVDGKVVVGGRSADPTPTSRFAVARLKAGGALDPTFSADGKVLTAFPGYDFAIPSDVAIQDDGKILMLGSVRMNAGRGLPQPTDFGIARYKPGGALDGSFGGDGRVTTDFAGNIDTANAMLVTPAGGILVAGVSGFGQDRIVLAKYLPNGKLDGGFSGDGKRVLNLLSDGFEVPVGIALRDDGRIVIGAAVQNAVSESSGGDIAVVLLNPNGTNSTSFGDGDGVVFADFGGQDGVSMMARDPNGKLYFSGTREQAGEDPMAIRVFRLNASGAKSTAFGDGGVVTVEFGESAAGTAVAVDGSHRPVVVGRADAGDPADFAVVRLEA